MNMQASICLDRTGPMIGSAGSQAPTSTLLIERARAIAAQVALRVPEIDSASRLPDDLVRDLRDAELFATLVPRIYGGHELGLETASEIIRTFAAVCPSVAWVVAFYIGHNWMHCQFPEQAQREIFADGPSPMSAGVLAPTFKLRAVEGGYRLSGRNSWNSGSPHANWIMSGGVVVEGDKSAGPIIFIVPRTDVALIDTWNMEGMRATGSWDVVFDDVFIPSYRTLPALALLAGQTPGSKVHASPFYSRPLLLLTYSYCLPVFVGATRGAVDEFVALTRTRVGTNDAKSAAVKPVAQMRAGRGEARTELAETLLDDLIASVMADDAPVRFDVAGRLALKARAAAIVEYCQETLNDVVLGAGANAFRKESKMQMIFRDINMISVHAFFERDAAMQGFGRELLGFPPEGPV